MESIFFLAILVGLAEGVAQYFWLPAYFKFGVPILTARIPDGTDDLIDHSKVVTFRPDHGGNVLIRQYRYGIARYAYFHGVVTSVDGEAGTVPKCTLFVDWNVFLFGAFLSSAFIGASLASVVAGAVLAAALCAIFVNRHREQILKESARALAQRQPP